MDASIDDHAGRISAAMLGAMAGEAAAGSAAGAADLLGVAESVAACGGFDESDLRSRGLERSSRSGSSGLLLRALPFGLATPLDRPRLRRAAYRCVTLAGADEGTAITAVAVAMLVADLLRFDLTASLIRVRQSLLEDAPSALLRRLTPEWAGEPPPEGDAVAALQWAIAAHGSGDTVSACVASAEPGPGPGCTLAGALSGARGGQGAAAGLDPAALPHGERALQVAARLAERCVVSGSVAGTAAASG
jgi:hypothetical protein